MRGELLAVPSSRFSTCVNHNARERAPNNQRTQASSPGAYLACSPAHGLAHVRREMWTPAHLGVEAQSPGLERYPNAETHTNASQQKFSQVHARIVSLGLEKDRHTARENDTEIGGFVRSFEKQALCFLGEKTNQVSANHTRESVF